MSAPEPESYRMGIRVGRAQAVAVVGRLGHALKRGDRVIIGRTTLPWVA